MKVGFIGAGNMGSALMASMKDHVELCVYDVLQTACEHANQKYGAVIANDVYELVKNSQVIFVAIKPQFLDEIYVELKEAWSEEKILASIVAGKSLSHWQEVLGENAQIARIMPNTPAMVGAGMTAAVPNAYLNQDEIDYVTTILESFGRVEFVPERLMDVVVSTSGSSPAYVYMMIEAMADAAVSGGMPRPQAYQFAAQAVLGSAKMVLETGMHPGALKDMVCSPGGTTIEAVRTLEALGFRSSIIEAMKVCEEKSKTM